MLLVWHGSVLPSVLPQLLLVLLISLGALYDDGRLLGTHVHLDTAPFSLLGISLAIFLAFRNNASYQRYLEARQLWGNILISSRSLTSQMLTSLPEGGSTTRRLPDRCKPSSAWRAPSTAQQRSAAGPGRLAAAGAGGEIGGGFVPAYPGAQGTAPHFNLAAQDLPHGGQLMQMFDAQLNNLGNSMGGCEAHRQHADSVSIWRAATRTVYAYCFLLPFGLQHAIGSGAVDLGSGGLHPVRTGSHRPKSPSPSAKHQQPGPQRHQPQHRTLGAGTVRTTAAGGTEGRQQVSARLKAEEKNAAGRK
jgi:putative membrane protein